MTANESHDDDVVDATRRTRLANERTYLAWLRTAFTALAVAIGVGRILPGVAGGTRWPFEVIGAGFALFAVAVTAYGARRYLHVERALDAGSYAPLDRRAAIALAAAGAVLGVVTLAVVFGH
jgi:putative membrane protein